ncbi:MAG: ABC transporter ATP-binding protein, partial [Campylobacterales bacterium]|nr:ABC transporter ATP-binding protein [Campylobacterales bacterium]
MEFLKKLKNLLSKRDKQFLAGLFIFSIFISLIETIGISSIMPFIGVASDFSLIETNEYYKDVYTFFGFANHINFVITFGFCLIGFYIFRSGINLFYMYLLSKFSKGRYHLLAYRLFENYMGMSYKNFVQKNSSTLTKSIIQEANNLTLIIRAVMFMISEFFVIVFIYSMMLYVNYKITLLLTLILIINALFLVKSVSKKIKVAGAKREEIQRTFYEIINKSFGNFKLIKLKSDGKKILDEFNRASFGYARANIINETLYQFPRLFLEAIGFGLVTFIIVFLVWKYQNDVKSILPVISMFVLGLYRLMPSVNRIMNGYNEIMFYHKSLQIVHTDLMYDIEDLGDKKIDFKEKIQLKNIHFEYETNKPVLNNISIEIVKGDKIAFIGESGSGKSTLVDIIIGLYKPISGHVLIDGVELNDTNIKSWRGKIGYIPQSVYLFDGSVGENVVFDREYDEVKIIECLKKAKIYDFLNQKEGIHTKVGEGGIMLSGGQKQRIAIARALYGEPEILVL